MKNLKPYSSNINGFILYKVQSVHCRSSQMGVFYTLTLERGFKLLLTCFHCFKGIRNLEPINLSATDLIKNDLIYVDIQALKGNVIPEYKHD